MRRKSESTSAAKREAHDRADAAMPDVAGLTVKQAEMALAEARNRERERREYERRKAKGKPLSKITQDAIRYEKCFESGVVKVEKGLYSITCDVDNMDYRNLGESEKEALYVGSCGSTTCSSRRRTCSGRSSCASSAAGRSSTRCSYPTSRTGSTACATRSTRCSPTARRRARRT